MDIFKNNICNISYNFYKIIWPNIKLLINNKFIIYLVFIKLNIDIIYRNKIIYPK